MSTATARAGPPGDEDLQVLYNQVWAGFAEESVAEQPQPSVSPSGRPREDLEDLYSAYAGDETHSDARRSRPTNGSPSAVGRSASAQPSTSVSRSSSATASPSLPTSPRDRPLPYAPTSPNQPRPYRKLPPVPGASSTYAMPEAKPYHSPDMSSQRQKYPSELSPAVLSPSGSSPNGVRQRPSGEYLDERAPRTQGIPPSPRPYYSQFQVPPNRPSSGSSSDSPVSHNSYSRSPNVSSAAYPMPVPEFSASENAHRTSDHLTLKLHKFLAMSCTRLPTQVRQFRRRRHRPKSSQS
ncbi:hypothetical protein NEOLEDRAFT_358672 [Neolentinus lepideus HHB14362 ss-1]|uniref:Uncharacterized protein n=1 Tax=Neolentinus lepideus HHB14362 ss-1 TaxID=1314782 RepID=A0A165SM35_9AGAM|nr:hypothetical protein NEOLEDRAFT_358672 [Neolentinus lepideus HHB14362 ss-1]